MTKHPDPTRVSACQRMLITTTDEIPGRSVRSSLGLVYGNTIRARHIGHDITAAFKNIVGGEVDEYTKMLAEAREQALDRMVEHALSLNADAIVGMRFSSAEVMQGAAEIVAYGTAVVLTPE